MKMMIMVRIQVSGDPTVFIPLTTGLWGLEPREGTRPGTCLLFSLFFQRILFSYFHLSTSKPVQAEGGTGTRDIA